jgi:hypothetical protein
MKYINNVYNINQQTKKLTDNSVNKNYKFVIIDRIFI